MFPGGRKASDMSVVVTAFPVPERPALPGKLSSGLDAQILVLHPAGHAQKGAL